MTCRGNVPFTTTTTTTRDGAVVPLPCEAESTSELSARLGLATSHAVLMQVLYISHRLDLLTTMHALGPSTCGHVAGELGLKERYLRELLHSLVCHGILTLSDNDLFSVPQKTVETLVKSSPTSRITTTTAGARGRGNGEEEMGGPDSFLGMPIMLQVMSGTIPGVLESFGTASARKGVSFDEFGPDVVDALEWMNAPGMRAHLLTQLERCGVTTALASAKTSLDIGCGSGTAVMLMAQKFPQCHFTGIDVSLASIEGARSKAQRAKLTNVTFDHRGVEDLDPNESWDVVTTFDVIHDVPHSSASLAAIFGCLRDNGGLYLMVEPRARTDPRNNIGARGGFLYGISLLHCLTQNLANDGEGLGAAWGIERQRALLEQAGFAADKVTLIEFEEEQVQSFWVCKR